MANHDTSVSARERRGTHIGRKDLRRPTVSELARANAADRERAWETYRKLTGAGLSDIAGLPGVPSESRLSHRRSDEENEIHRLDALVRAVIRTRSDPHGCGALLVHFADTIEQELARHPISLAEVLVSDAHHDAEQDVAAAELWASGDLEGPALDRFIAAQRKELASKRVLLTVALMKKRRAA